MMTDEEKSRVAELKAVFAATATTREGASPRSVSARRGWTSRTRAK